jgi:hypothetical protein
MVIQIKADKKLFFVLVSSIGLQQLLIPCLACDIIAIYCATDDEKIFGAKTKSGFLAARTLFSTATFVQSTRDVDNPDTCRARVVKMLNSVQDFPV